ncbi:MAG TPA: diguanylate cyclase [Ilumatobacteraceae bacterium]|nr:diguanylate cyclase [Ilumatobacteraceae bacterium]
MKLAPLRSDASAPDAPRVGRDHDSAHDRQHSGHGRPPRERSRGSDIVGRIGGDEFALLLPATTLDAAARHAGRVFQPSGSGRSTVSFGAGVATLDPTEPTTDRLFRDADATLYHVKRHGGGRIAITARSEEPTSVDLENGNV